MISWVPLLGKEGLVNQILITIGVINQPPGILLYSDFAVVLGMVHLYIIFMIAPIFNSLMRIDRTLITASEDLAHLDLKPFKEVVLPLSAPGVAIGSILIVTSDWIVFDGAPDVLRPFWIGGKASSTKFGSFQYLLVGRTIHYFAGGTSW